MKVTIPDHIGDVTLGQNQEWLLLKKRTDLPVLEYNKRKLCIFTNLKYNEVSGVSMKDYDHLLKKVDQALELSPPFKNKFKMDGVEFGFIPNLDTISTVEYADILEYEKDPQDLHLVMAILFRPIKNKDAFGNYSIETYHGTGQYGHKMKDMPLSIANMANTFFLNLNSELLMSTENSILNHRMKIEKAKKKIQKDSLKSGVGTPALWRLQKAV